MHTRRGTPGRPGRPVAEWWCRPRARASLLPTTVWLRTCRDGRTGSELPRLLDAGVGDALLSVLIQHGNVGPEPFERVRQVLEVRLVVEERVGLVVVAAERIVDRRADRQLRQRQPRDAGAELGDRR